jgi:hypothetical protein
MVGATDSESLTAEEKLKKLGIELPASPTPFGTYVESVQTGNLLFLSGMLPVEDHKPRYVGFLGKELDAELAGTRPELPRSVRSPPPESISVRSTESHASFGSVFLW